MNMIRKLFFLVLLKISEISCVIYIPFLIGKFPPINNWLRTDTKYNDIRCWFCGLTTIVFVFAILVIMYFLFIVILRWIDWNWKIINNGKGIYWIECLI